MSGGTWTIVKVLTVHAVDHGATSDSDLSQTTCTFNTDGTGTAENDGTGNSPFASPFIWENTKTGMTINSVEYTIAQNTKEVLVLNKTVRETIEDKVHTYYTTIYFEGSN